MNSISQILETGCASYISMPEYKFETQACDFCAVNLI